ncbi:MAG: chromosome segregation protein [Opitutaceae bacterium]|nr:chromosome segregation protein [Opitutaceae bacterium]
MLPRVFKLERLALRPIKIAQSLLIGGFLVFVSGSINVSAEEESISFNKDIRPILSDICFQCHGPDANSREADLRLDARESAMADRGGYSALVPGDPDESELIWLIFSEDSSEQMPPSEHPRQLSQAEKELIRDWVEQGAEYEAHWAFIPPEKNLPDVEDDRNWARNEIDAFVLAKLDKEGLEPSPEADKETLIRRLSLDLNGIPPTLEEIERFLSEGSPEAYESLVDRLLASPRYGERMVWEWLEASRYADSNGYQNDDERGMWPWRDWVIDAMNENMPFDKFTIEQIAGDLLAESSQDQKLATAFLRNHMINGEGGRLPEENRIDYLVDQTDTVSTIWMGLTMGCARCHDHKYDPISQKEYYQLMAFFDKTEVDGKGRDPQTPPVLDLTTDEHDRRMEDLKQAKAEAAERLDEVEKILFPRPEGKLAIDSERAKSITNGTIQGLLKQPVNERRPEPLIEVVAVFGKTEPEYVEKTLDYIKAYQDLDIYGKSRPIVMIMEDTVERDTYILENGLYDSPTEKVITGFPAALNGGFDETGDLNRLDLANWLMADENPLTARVTVNRYWQQFFGRGILPQVENFGVQSKPPTYEDLLDWLAVEFKENGWDVKAIHKLIVMSATYRQSSRVDPELLERDPENELLARGPRFRMPSWMLRDQALALGGLLNETSGGPPVKPYQPEGIWEEASFGFIKYYPDTGEELYRRSLYTFWRRIVGPPVFFDSGARQVCEVKSLRTNTPLHALTTLNDTTYAEAARSFAQRILTELEGSDAMRLREAFRMATSRYPNRSEAKTLKNALTQYRKHFTKNREAATEVASVGESQRDGSLDPIDHASWSTLGLMLLNLDETLTKE